MLALFGQASEDKEDRGGFGSIYFLLLLSILEHDSVGDNIQVKDFYKTLLALWRKYKNKNFLLAALSSYFLLKPEKRRVLRALVQGLGKDFNLCKCLQLAEEQFANKETQFPPACFFLSKLPDTLLQEFIGEGWQTYKETYIFYSQSSTPIPTNNDIIIF